jgi:hypothetical protein
MILHANVLTFRDKKFERLRLVTPVGTTINSNQRMHTIERVHSSGVSFPPMDDEIMKENRSHRWFL